MSITDQNLTAFSDQINDLVAENRRFRLQSEADANTIRLLKGQYEELSSSVEDMIQYYRRRERELISIANKAKLAYTEIDGLLNQAATIILQAARAQIGDQTPEKIPPPHLPSISDDRLPMVAISQ